MNSNNSNDKTDNSIAGFKSTSEPSLPAVGTSGGDAESATQKGAHG